MAGRFFSFTIAKNSFILDGTHQQGLREKHDFIFFSDRKLQIRGGKNSGIQDDGAVWSSVCS